MSFKGAAENSTAHMCGLREKDDFFASVSNSYVMDEITNSLIECGSSKIYEKIRKQINAGYDILIAVNKKKIMIILFYTYIDRNGYIIPK